LIVLFQFINAAAIFNFEHYHRSSWYKNPSLIFIYFLFIGFALYLTLAPPNPISGWFRISCGSTQILENEFGMRDIWWNIPDYNSSFGHNVIPMESRIILWIMCLMNCGVTLMYEKWVVLAWKRKKV